MNEKILSFFGSSPFDQVLTLILQINKNAMTISQIYFYFYLGSFMIFPQIIYINSKVSGKLHYADFPTKKIWQLLIPLIISGKVIKLLLILYGLLKYKSPYKSKNISGCFSPSFF
jgi:hypothetical protein